MSADDSSDIPDLPPEVQSWLDEHPAADAETLKEVWRLSGTVPPVMEPAPKRVSTIREALQHATETDRLRSEPEDPPERNATASQADDRSATSPSRRWTAWATGATLLVLVMAVSVYSLAIPAHVTVPPGQTRTVAFADGSRVELNSGTTLRYPRWWRVGVLRSWLGRSVHLEGEAFFAVAETDTPFRVETKNAEVQVKGTHFNVRARRVDGHPETRVVVADGCVTLAAAGKTTRLDSAETATVRGTAPPSPGETVSLDRALAWRRGGFSFTDASIRTISTELARRFDVSITVRPGVADRAVTLHVDTARGPAPLLRDVCSVAGCQVDSTMDGLTIRAGR